MTTEQDRFMTLAAACEYLSCDRSTIYRLRKGNQIIGYALNKKTGKNIRYLKSNLDTHMGVGTPVEETAQRTFNHTFSKELNQA